MPATIDSYRSLDERLLRAGYYATTDWMMGKLEQFYEGSACTLIGQCGRGATKSVTGSKVGLNETVNGDWEIPPGERHYFAFVSSNKEEAQQRLHLIQSFLTALG